MKLSGRNRQKEASFDLTPMIDVLLLLIVFFTLTSQFSSTQRTPMDLPRERGEPDPSKASTELFIDLDRDGGVMVLGQPYDLGTLQTLLAGREFAVEHPDDPDAAMQPVEVVIRADRNCSTANLNAVAQVLLRVGVRRWSLATSAEGGS